MQINQTILEKLNTIEAMLQVQQTRPMAFQEAAKYLDVSPSHLYKLTSGGKIPHFKPQGKKLYFEKSELDQWLMQNPVKTISQIEQDAVNRVTFGVQGAL